MEQESDGMSYIVPRNKPDRCTNCPFMVKELYDCKLQNGKRYICIDKQYANCPLIELPFAEELVEKLYKQIEKAVIEGSET